jgi:hypothetical protein
MIEVKKYNSNFFDDWNNFLKDSKNGTFISQREFVEYHRDRFTDYSLIVFNKKKVVALFPANIDGKTLSSHAGLTFGGLIVGKTITLNDYLNIFKRVLVFLHGNGIEDINYKSVPVFYTSVPSQEEEYAFFLLKANNYRVDTSITVKNSESISFQGRRKRMIKKAKNNDFSIRVDNDFKAFWTKILSPNLHERFEKNPVHDLNEIELLHSKFPNNIHQINIYDDQEIIAGCTVFETELVCHAQYISGNDYGRKSGALDMLFEYLITDLFREKEFFDFGICNEENGKYINHGLLNWKEGFGGRTYVHKFYKVITANYHLLETVIKEI